MKLVARVTEKCPLSVLTGVRIKQAKVIENVRAFRWDIQNCTE